MNLSKFHALIIEDSILKANDIRKALIYNGITNTLHVNNQADAWTEIYISLNGETKLDLIVTDMHYPLEAGAFADEEAGFKLIERMKQEGIDIPVIICSTRNYNMPGILGSVWYSKLRDIEEDFEVVLSRLE